MCCFTFATDPTICLTVPLKLFYLYTITRQVIHHDLGVFYILRAHQGELAEASKADAAARALKAAGRVNNNDRNNHASLEGGGDRGIRDEGLGKKEKERKLHRMTRKKRRRILAQEADKREEEQEKEELRAQGQAYG